MRQYFPVSNTIHRHATRQAKVGRVRCALQCLCQVHERVLDFTLDLECHILGVLADALLILNQDVALAPLLEPPTVAGPNKPIMKAAKIKRELIAANPWRKEILVWRAVWRKPHRFTRICNVEIAIAESEHHAHIFVGPTNAGIEYAVAPPRIAILEYLRIVSLAILKQIARFCLIRLIRAVAIAVDDHDRSSVERTGQKCRECVPKVMCPMQGFVGKNDFRCIPNREHATRALQVTWQHECIDIIDPDFSGIEAILNRRPWNVAERKIELIEEFLELGR